MKTQKVNVEVDGYYCPEIKSRWKSYNSYKLLLWAWMMNEITIIFTPTEVSHNGFFIHGALQAGSVVLIGLPLAYSEICLGQYTNCNLFTMWDFFPLFRNMGYASYYVISIKAMYLLVLTSWHLIYTFYSAMDTPPWLNCNEFADSKCMVKRVNVSVFQHCLEAQALFENDCGMKTASKCFFEREIGDNCTKKNPYCYQPWKTIIALITICITVYILSIKDEKFIQIIVKFYAIFICIVTLVLFGVALSTNGTWYAKKISSHLTSYTFCACFTTISRGFLSVGAGLGILMNFSRDVPFRSPATMTAISTSLFALFVAFIFALIAFSGIKTVSYYHGEEENISESGSNLFFLVFASMSEIMIYFEPLLVWGFVWFSVGLLSLFINFWILYLFLKESMLNSFNIAHNYTKFSSMILMVMIGILTLPMLCSDITGIITDALEIMQTINSFLFSVSLYWIYGIHNHNVDIIFMIGIKANYFWKVAWILNPLFLLCILYRAWDIFLISKFGDSYYISSLGMETDILILYIILGIYGLIIICGILAQFITYVLNDNLSEVLSPSSDWGPKDGILSRSRSMFVPEIMTREFLYRQVRIRGYQKRQKKIEQKLKVSSHECEPSANSGT